MEGSKPPAKAEETDESLLLATIGSKIASSTTYEANVIREASYQSAPTLGGIGFPDLSPLAPSFQPSRPNGASNKRATNGNSNRKSYNGSADLPYVLSALSQTRSALHAVESRNHGIETRNANVLRMKLQILQSYCETVANLSPEEMNENKKSEISTEKKRSAALKHGDATQDVQNDQEKSNHLQSTSSTSTRKRQGNRLTPLQTLELAKKGLLPLADEDEDGVKITSSSTMASFGKQALLDREMSIHTKSIKRQSMMQMKRALNDIPDGVAKSGLGGLVSIDFDYLKELRRKRRESRKRKRSALNDSSSDEDDAKNKVEEIIENSQAVERGEEETRSSETVEEKTEPTTRSSETVEEKREPTVELLCPICSCKFEGKDIKGDPDEFLSAHIDECQRRGIRRRSSRNSASRVSYDERSVGSSIEKRGTKSRQNAAHAKEVDFSVDSEESDKEHHKSTSKSKNENGRENTKLKVSKTTKKKVNRDSSAVVGNEMVARDDLELWEYEERVDDWIESGIAGMACLTERNADEKPPGKARFPGGLTIPAWVNNRLFPYQRSALRWLWELHKQQSGSVLGDEMGLGKTVQVSSFLGSMALCRKLDCILLISPATLLDHWLRELAIWAPGLRRVLVHKSGESDGYSREVSSSMLKKLDKWLWKARSEFYNEPLGDDDSEDEDTFCGTGYVILTSYENLRRNADVWVAHSWSYVVIDEGQRIKNPDADITLACKRLRTPHRVLISATPISNDLAELWSLFDFVVPGRLGTLPSFESEFAEPIKRGGYANASPMQVQLAYRCALVLRDLINPYLLRRQKKDIAEVQKLPGKTEHILFCRLSDLQRMLYEAYLESEEVKSVLRGSSQCFKAITVLRKICNHPDLVYDGDEESARSFIKNRCNLNAASSSDESEFETEDTSESKVDCCGKLTVLAKILPLWKMQGHRVLIFCQWRKMLNIIQRFMVDNEWKFARIDGATNVGVRQALVDRFNGDTSYFAMLLTTRTGGVGLNLVGADRVILWDPDWNPQVDAQARERSYRFGQTKAVTIYRMITAGTIEEKIYHRQIFKTALSERVLQDPRQRRLFSQKDLKDLFSLKPNDARGEELTDTARLMKAKGLINPDVVQQDVSDSPSKNDENNALGALLRSKGLACVFDHDVVDNSSLKKSRVDIEMEELAKKAAKNALKAIEQSNDQVDAFTPTWTGSEETRPQRFGDRQNFEQPAEYSVGTKAGVNATYEDSFGGAMSAGFNVTNGRGEGKSSANILARLQGKRPQQG